MVVGVTFKSTVVSSVGFEDSKVTLETPKKSSNSTNEKDFTKDNSCSSSIKSDTWAPKDDPILKKTSENCY